MSMRLRSEWLAAALIATVAGLWLIGARVGERANHSHAAGPVAQETETAGRGSHSQDEPAKADPGASGNGNSQPCLTAAQLDNHPILIEDSYRFDTVSDSGPTIESYRGLSEHELLNLATQGDSAAMAVLGAMSVMRAREWPVQKAVPFLLHEESELASYRYRRPLSAEFLKHMAQAREWFYDSALHGRVLTLYRVGDALSLEKGGAVELGWIDSATHDSLSNREKTALMPSNVYNRLAYEIAPGLKTGPFGELMTELIPRSEKQQEILAQLAEQFSRDLAQAGLQAVVVPESMAPPREDLMELLCASERTRIMDEAESGNHRP